MDSKAQNISPLGDFREAWKARGRELNDLYDALTQAVGKSPSGGDPVADIRWLAAERDRYREALRTILGPEDSGPWIEVYRAVGGGYEGLQAIARVALDDS